MIDPEVLNTWHERLARICRAVQQAEQAGRVRPTSAQLILDQLGLAQERVKTLNLHSDRWITDPLRSARILAEGAPDIEQAIVAARCRVERRPEPIIAKPKPKEERPIKPYIGPVDTQCAYPGCTRGVRARGYCASHYTKLRADGTLEVNRISRAWCVVEGCENTAYAKGWCRYHYRLHGVTGKYDQRKKQAQKCSVDGCERRPGAYGLCGLHLEHKRKYGQVHTPPRQLKQIEPSPGDKICVANGCGRPAVARYFCMRHYKQRQRKKMRVAKHAHQP